MESGVVSPGEVVAPQTRCPTAAHSAQAGSKACGQDKYKEQPNSHLPQAVKSFFKNFQTV